MIWSKRRLRERLVMALFEQAKTPGTQMSVDELIFAAAFLERFILSGSAPTPQAAIKQAAKAGALANVPNASA